MAPVHFKCPLWFVGSLIGGALVLAVFTIKWVIPFFHLPHSFFPYVWGAAAVIALFAIYIMPSQIVLSDEGLTQKQLLTRFTLRWDAIADWQLARTQDIPIFWLKDRAGKTYHLKTWLMMGKRSRQIARILSEKGVRGRQIMGH